MMDGLIGLREAAAQVHSGIGPLAAEWLPLAKLAGRISAADVQAAVDSPDADVSRKDGYAVLPDDLRGAGPDHPVRLRVVGAINAGAEAPVDLGPGQALRVTTGARMPTGVDAAVLAEEFAEREGEWVICSATAGPGRNVMTRAADVAQGEAVVRAGERLTPGAVGLLAAAGLAGAEVHQLPRVAVLATGDEVVAPGQSLGPGQLFASNLVELACWLARFGLEAQTEVVGDSPAEIRAALNTLLRGNDAVLTTGGAWTSEKDLMVSVLGELGWHKAFHRVRLGPGKGVGFGMIGDKPVFCLPGGPPSCEMAFLQLALPGLLRLAGHSGSPFPETRARLASDLDGQRDWTQVIHARIEERGDGPWAVPLRLPSRLKSMARAQALITIPEGVTALAEGETIPIQRLDLAGAC